MPISYAQETIAGLNWLLQKGEHPPLENSRIMFVLDTDVSYEDEWTVPASKLIKTEQLDKQIEPIISSGPDWIHANLIPTTDRRQLITLRFGASVGNPAPSINVSCEVHQVIKVTKRMGE